MPSAFLTNCLDPPGKVMATTLSMSCSGEPGDDHGGEVYLIHGEPGLKQVPGGNKKWVSAIRVTLFSKPMFLKGFY